MYNIFYVIYWSMYIFVIDKINCIVRFVKVKNLENIIVKIHEFKMPKRSKDHLKKIHYIKYV